MPNSAAEKCLKACLAAGGALLPRTHLIADLLQQLPTTAQGTVAGLEQDLLTLDQFYIPTRYPDALPGSITRGAASTVTRCHGTGDGSSLF